MTAKSHTRSKQTSSRFQVQVMISYKRKYKKKNSSKGKGGEFGNLQSESQPMSSNHNPKQRKAGVKRSYKESW